MKRRKQFFPLALVCVLPAVATGQITMRIDVGSVDIAKDDRESEKFREQGPNGSGVLLTCKKMHLHRNKTTYLLRCTDAQFSLADGKQCHAPEAEFDLLTKRVVLTGTSRKQVQVVNNTNPGETSTQITAANMQLFWRPITHRGNQKNTIAGEQDRSTRHVLATPVTLRPLNSREGRLMPKELFKSAPN